MANILIADDSVVMRKNLKSIITRMGHNIVAEAINGQQAQMLYNKDEIDIVTMDITMPVMDGIEALKKILLKDPEAKVIIISALDQKRMVFQALECGAKYYIIKPVTEEKIANAINKVLNHEPNSEVQNQHEDINEVKKLSELVQEQSPTLPPFTIDNKDSSFIINMNTTLNMNNIITLNSTLDSLMFIKPLKVTFNFDVNAKYSSDVLNVLVKISKRIKALQGEFKIIAEESISILF